MSIRSRKLLLTGIAGHLGHRVAALANDWDLIGSWHFSRPDPSLPGSKLQLDLCDAHAVRTTISEQRPTAIIHTACSNRSETSIVPSAHNLATAAAEHEVRLVHVSTDSVLDGNHAPYKDDAKPNPLSPYGEAKATAENIILAHCPHSVVVRTSLIFGTEPLDHQTRWLLTHNTSGEPVYLFTDELRCPIWVNTLAHALLELAAGDYTGMLNIASPKPINRWEFGVKMLAMLGLKPNPNVRPALQGESDLIRPSNLTLDVSRAKHQLRTPLTTVDEAIKYINGGNRPTL